MPTLGYSANGASSDTWGDGYLAAGGKWVKSGTETVSKATGRLAGDPAGAKKVRVVVYGDTAGNPGNIVATSDEITVAQSAAMANYDFTFTSPPSLTGGATYWLGYWFNGTLAEGYDVYGTGGTGLVFNSSGDRTDYAAGQTYASTGNPASPYPTRTSFVNEQMTLFLTFAAAGGPPGLAARVNMPAFVEIRPH